MKTKKRIIKPLVAVLTVIAVLFAGYSFTTAWITGTLLNPVRFASLGDFEADVNVTFGGAPAAQDAVLGTIAVSFNPADENYIGNLRASVTFSGTGVAFMRVKMIAEWQINGMGQQASVSIPFVIDDDAVTGNTNKWYDNRANDYCVYYTSAPSAGTVQLITGFDTSAFDIASYNGIEGLTLKLAFTVDAVQFNRYKQIWEIDSLPWRA